MATKAFQAQNDDWESTSNWGGPAPVNDDDVTLRKHTQALVQNLQQTAAGEPGVSGNALDSLYFTKDAVANIGGVGNSLEINADILRFEGGGEEAFIRGAFPIVHAFPLQRTPNALVLGSLGSSSADDIGVLYVHENRTVIAGSTKIVDMYIMEGEADVFINANTSPFGITNLYIDGGRTVVNEADIATVHNASGEFVHQSGTITTYNQTKGGKGVWTDGAMTNINVRGGVFDATQHSAATTVAALLALTGAFVDLRTGYGSITVTALNKIGRAIVHED